MPSVSEKVSKKAYARLRKLGVRVMLNSRVESESENTLTVNGKSIPTQTVVWTAGVTSNPFFSINAAQFTFNDRGKVVVDEHLMIDAHTYVVGDNAATEFSGLALTAVHNAQYVAKDIKRKLHGLPRIKAYKPLKPATVVPIGSHWAIMQYRSIVISGFLGAMLRSAADFVGYMDVLGFWKALEVWASTATQEEQCKICKVQLAQQKGAPELLEAS
jgi:NADH dehydrogenase